MIELHIAVLNATRARRSIRRHTNPPVDRVLIDMALDAATYSPSAYNRRIYFQSIERPRPA